MKNFAVVKIGPFQYNIEEGKTYTVPNFKGDQNQKIEIKEVLIAGNEKESQFGTPFLEKAKVVITILEQGKGEKITSRIYKAKSRYRKTKGFRKKITTFKVEKISF